MQLLVATREGGVDRNLVTCDTNRYNTRSPPARVAWIETIVNAPLLVTVLVATREGGVDRNGNPYQAGYMPNVATREGGVDRNTNATIGVA